MVVVSGNFDAADDWIVENAKEFEIIITSDILLADRLIKNKCRVLGPKGHEWTEDNIGHAVATRELMAHLRQTGEAKGGPAPMAKQDRSQFLAKLDQIVQSIKNARRP
jgi:uncharacterized protein YaiI (UPF0178 family)